MTTFTLDTSGMVFPMEPRVTVGASAANAIMWNDLDPFTQGYVEALFAELNGRRIRATNLGLDPYGFSDLSPEALAMILADCAAWLAQYSAIDRNAESGARFWAYRQAQDVLRLRFPPLTVSLGDDGKVRLSTMSEACTCANVPMGSYANQDTLTPPWRDKVVGIDRCIRPEIERLWGLGVRTIESCCGHGAEPGYIAVTPEFDGLMIDQGYERDPATTSPHVFLWPQPVNETPKTKHVTSEAEGER